MEGGEEFERRTFDLETANEFFQIEGMITRIGLVPEPSVCALLVTAAFSLWRRRRDGRRGNQEAA